ncbi:slipin family protein [Taibaiella koreensis]|uniref:slipin family protein n=1 Tax=Taibaiella koreensis TaxID=1268548 RepID=UPI000E59A97E|nr:slipin family protein [Taibaiella koreensis]
MKKIRINANHVGLVFRKGSFQRVVTEGDYWLGFGEKVEVYDCSRPLQLNHDMDVLLQHPGFAEAITINEVGDNELALFYLNGNFRSVLGPGRHFYWNSLSNYTFLKADTSALDIPVTIDRNLLDKAPLNAHVRAYKVEAYEQALLFIDGKYSKLLEAGQYYWWKNSTTVHIAKADMRQQAMDINGQEILTRDKAQLRINFTIQYKVVDIVKALADNREYDKQLYTLMQLALREFIGGLNLDELMDSKERIAEAVRLQSMERVAGLGIALHYCGVKDIILPGDVKDILNQVLIAEKKAQANIITRREETASTRSLLNTAKLMEDNQMLYKLKEMEYVEKIAEKIHTISLSGGGQIVDQLKQIFIKQ